MKKQAYIDMGIQSGLEISQIEAVLCHVLGLSKTQLYTLQEISSNSIYQIQQAFYAIASGTPSEYTLKQANFYGRDFFVDARVLIPRNDTELLVEQALKCIHLDIDVEDTVYIDVGTGSGCIPVSIIGEMSPLKFFQSFAVDLSQDALEVAQKNIQQYTPEKIEVLGSNLLEVFFSRDELSKKQLFITANLPYIKQGDIENMESQVLRHEPHTALFGGKDTGFELYETLIKQCFQLKHVHTLSNIHLFIEIGFDQYEYSRKFLEDFGLLFEYFRDSASIYRVIHIYGF